MNLGRLGPEWLVYVSADRLGDAAVLSFDRDLFDKMTFTRSRET